MRARPATRAAIVFPQGGATGTDNGTQMADVAVTAGSPGREKG
jgi:hypothetical protein